METSGFTVTVSVTRSYVESTLLPLAISFLELLWARQGRVLIEVAGGAGTGKTVLCTLLCRALQPVGRRRPFSYLTSVQSLLGRTPFRE
ncbi:MAG: hypothetical protein AB1486_34045 [Planctomycetota bacterium]